MTQNESANQADPWTTSRVILATLFVVAIGFSFYLVYRLQNVVFLFFVSVVIGTALKPAVEWLSRRGVLRPVGLIGIYLIIGLLLAGFLALVLPLLADQATELARNIPEYYDNFRSLLLNSPSRLFQNLALQLPANPALFPQPEPTAEETLSQFNQAYSMAAAVLKAFLGAFAIFLMAYYWALEGNRALRSLLRVVPVRRRKGLRQFIAEAETRLGGFIRAQGILSLTVGTAAFIGYSLIGLPYALVLGILAGIFEMIPVFGPALGAIPALLASLTLDPGKTVWVLVLTGVIQLAENVWLVPRVMNRSVGVNPILTLLALVTFGSVFGTGGAVLAIPMAALIQLVLDRVMQIALPEMDENGKSAPNGPLVTVPDLAGEAADIRTAFDRIMADLGKQEKTR